MKSSRQVVVEVLVLDVCVFLKCIPEVRVHGASSAWVAESNAHLNVGQEPLYLGPINEECTLADISIDVGGCSDCVVLHVLKHGELVEDADAQLVDGGLSSFWNNVNASRATP
jgi:hypothetical protein